MSYTCPYCRGHVRNSIRHYSDEELRAVHDASCPDVHRITNRKRHTMTTTEREPVAPRCYSCSDEERANPALIIEHLWVDTGLDLNDDNDVIETRHCAWCRTYQHKLHESTEPWRNNDPQPAAK